MELIRQRTKTDCGVACVAMLAGVPYGQALAAFDFPPRQRDRRTTETQVRAALTRLGLHVQPMTPMGRVPVRNAMLKCNRGARRIAGVKRWHWCVWCATTQKVLDPVGDGVVRPALSHMEVEFQFPVNHMLTTGVMSACMTV